MNYKHGKRGHRLRSLVTIILAILLLAIGVAAYSARSAYQRGLKPFDLSSQKNVYVTIPIGSTPGEISKILKDKSIIGTTWVFDWYIRNKGLRDKLQAALQLPWLHSVTPPGSVLRYTLQSVQSQDYWWLMIFPAYPLSFAGCRVCRPHASWDF